MQDDVAGKPGRISPPRDKPSLKAPSPKRESFVPTAQLSPPKKPLDSPKTESPNTSSTPASNTSPASRGQGFPMPMMPPAQYEAYAKQFPHPMFFVQPGAPHGHPAYSPHMQYIAIPTMPGGYPGMPVHPMALQQAYAASKAHSTHSSQPPSKEEVGKPYACTYDNCNKRFADASNAKRHELSHIGYKPYSCTVEGCNKRFTRRTSLRAHLTGVHKLSADHPAFVKAILRRVRVPKLTSVMSHTQEQQAFMPTFAAQPMPQVMHAPVAPVAPAAAQSGAPRSPSRLVAPQTKSRIGLSTRPVPASISSSSPKSSDLVSFRAIHKDKSVSK